MKKLFILSIFAFFTISASAQLVRGNRPYSTIDTKQGYITINEFTYGYGLGSQAIPYSKSFIGFTSLHGFQVNEIFMAGAGTGMLIYESGLMVPLYLDMRIRIPMNEFTPYASGSGGMLLATSSLNAESRMFINPAVGVRYSLSRNLGFTVSGGLWIQMGPSVPRSSFVNIKGGVVYKF